MTSIALQPPTKKRLDTNRRLHSKNMDYDISNDGFIQVLLDLYEWNIKAGGYKFK